MNIFTKMFATPVTPRQELETAVARNDLGLIKAYVEKHGAEALRIPISWNGTDDGFNDPGCPDWGGTDEMDAPLIKAILRQDVDMINYLLDTGVFYVNGTFGTGRTRFIDIADPSRPKSLAALLAHGARPYYVDGEHGNSILLQYSYEGDDECLIELLKYAPDPSEHKLNAAITFMYSLEGMRDPAGGKVRSSTLALWLVQNGVRPDWYSLPAEIVHAIMRHATPEFISLLLGIIEYDDDWWGVHGLDHALFFTICYNGNYKTLLDAGADPKHTDELGYTPLHVAAEKGHLSKINLLLEYSPDLYLALTDEGDRPIDLANYNGRRNVARALQRHANIRELGGRAPSGIKCAR